LIAAKKLSKNNNPVQFSTLKEGQPTTPLQDSVLFAIYEKITNSNSPASNVDWI
jgi:hypothetical protein